MNQTPQDLDKLRQKIIALSQRRNSHQINNDEYVDLILDVIAQETKKAEVSGQIKAYRHIGQLELENIGYIIPEKIKELEATLNKETKKNK